MQSEFCTQAETVDFAGMSARFLLGGSAAPATVIDMTIRQNGGAPLHQSLDEEKFFTVMEGKLEFTLGTVTHTLQPGSCARVACGEVHGFVNPATAAAKLFLVSIPSRHDAFFRAMAAIPLPHDPEAVRQVCQEYRQVIVGL